MVTHAQPEVGRAARDAGVYVASRVVAALLQVVGFILAARLYSADGLALVVYALMVLQTSVSLGSLGIPESVFTFFAWYGRPDVVVRQATFLLVVVLPPVLLVATGLAHVAGASIDLGSGLPWLMVAVAAELPAQPAVNLLLAVDRAGRASLATVSFTAAQMVAVVLPALLGRDAHLVLPLLAAASAFRVAVYLVIVRVHFPRRSPWLDRDRLKALVTFSVPAGLAVISGTLGAQIDKYVVAWLRGGHDIADYSVGAWELPLVTLIPYAIGAVLQPHYARLHVAGQRAGLIALWRRTTRKTALLVVPLAVLQIVLADRLVQVVFPPEYARAGLLFRLFSLVLLTRVAYYGAILRATGDTRALLVAALFVLGVNLVLSVPFTLLFGFPGAALATVTAGLAGMIVVLRFIARRLGAPVAEIFPTRAYAGVLAISSVTGLLAYLGIEHLPLGPVAGALVVTPVYLAATFGLTTVFLKERP